MGKAQLNGLIGFGASHFGRTVVWVAADLYALYALTRVAGLADVAAGGVFLLVMLFSAACDVAVGWLIDRYGSPGPRALAAAAILSSAAFAISLSSGWPPVAVAAAFAFRFAYAIYDVPHNALVKRLGPANGEAAVTVSAVRFLTGAAASFAVAGLAAWLVGSQGRGLDRLAAVAAVVAGGAMVAYAPVMARLGGASLPRPSRGQPSVVGAMAMLAVVALLGAVLGGLVTKALAFLAETDLGSARWTGRALAILTIGRVCAAPIWAWAGHRLQLILLTAVAFGVVGVGGAALAVAPSARVVEIALLVLGAGFGGVTVYSWALLPDLSDALGRGRARDPIHTAVAAYTAINKLALGVGGGVMGALLAWMNDARADASLSHAVGLIIVGGSLACAAMLTVAGRGLRGMPSG